MSDVFHRVADENTPFRDHVPGSQPENNSPEYGSTHKRHPKQARLRIPQTVTEIAGPRFSTDRFPAIADITRNGTHEALGERIILRGRVVDEDNRPVPHTMIEIWQANAGGRYNHPNDQHDAPLDPHFKGEGRVFSDAEGWYQFITIKPGSYPWRNHYNAWRPNHIHFSLFGAGFATRLITQMYFPGDPLLELDPVFHAVPDEQARQRLVAKFDIEITRPEWALGYRFDFVLRGRETTIVQE